MGTILKKAVCASLIKHCELYIPGAVEYTSPSLAHSIIQLPNVKDGAHTYCMAQSKRPN